ncbi:MAG: PQQ-binding-like beta-propeller repeat protein [Phycisphaerae bacterium]
MKGSLAMRYLGKPRLNLLLACTLLAALAPLPAAQADDDSSAKAVLDLAAPAQKKGLCIHLGCGSEASPGLTADLAAASGMLVHGLALDDAAVTRARSAIAAKGVAGQALVDKLADMKSLPYLRDMANLVVIEDFAALSSKGLTMDEVMRITAPGGAVCTFKDGKWTKAVKPRPPSMDEWTHPHYSAGGTRASADRPEGSTLAVRWLDGLPFNIAGFTCTRAYVTAGGRMFALTTNEVENFGQQRGGESYDLWLVARDAFNGLPLWKINCGIPEDGIGIEWRNAGPLVADGERVYAPMKDKAVAADAGTGKIVANFDTKHPVARLLELDKVLVAACWEGKARPKPYEGAKDPYDSGFLWVPKTDNGEVAGFDSATGARKWSLQLSAFQILAADGVVYAVAQKGNPPTERRIIAIDLQSGKDKWSVDSAKLGAPVDALITSAGKGFVVVVKPKDKLTFILAAEDGHTLWQAKAGGNWTPIVDGHLWVANQKWDPLTGQNKGGFGTWLSHLGCNPASVDGRFVVNGGAMVEWLSSSNPTTRPARTAYRGVRSCCGEGVIGANGMFYTAQNICRCTPWSMYGFMAFGPYDREPTAEDFAMPRPVEKGPAFADAPKPAPAVADDWPTYRANAERSAAVAAQLPAKLKELWKAHVASADGPMAAAWKPQLLAPITAPAVAGGLAFVAAVDRGELVAIDAAGKKAWSAQLGGRIDTPPTIHNGLCLVGCHDGWLYALRAKDGALAWRVRIAPLDQRMVAFGSVESLWPVIGSPLVHNDVVYANAGRSSESEGGVALVALKPADGQTIWAKPIGAGSLRVNDLLALRNEHVGWRHIEFDPKDGQRVAPTSLPAERTYGGGAGKYEGPILDSSWTQMRNARRSGKAFTIGKVTANLMAWNDKFIVTPTDVFSRESQERLWRIPKANTRERQVEAIALAGDKAILAGRVSPRPGAWAGECKGFLLVLSCAEGTTQAEFDLDSPPAYDGLAVAGGRICVCLHNGDILCLGKAE